jgi:hypothetical protein
MALLVRALDVRQTPRARAGSWTSRGRHLSAFAATASRHSSQADGRGRPGHRRRISSCRAQLPGCWVGELTLGRVAESIERFADAAVTASQIGDDWLFAHTQSSLGNAYFLAGDMGSARSCYGEALAIRRRGRPLWDRWTAFRLGVLTGPG